MQYLLTVYPVGQPVLQLMDGHIITQVKKTQPAVREVKKRKVLKAKKKKKKGTMHVHI